MTRVLMIVALALLTTHLAHAEFLVKAAQPLLAPSVPSQLPVAAPAAPNEADSASLPPKPRFKMAYGFGRDVPLAFACRQIVPRAVRIAYGPGADRAALVSWHGGDIWNRVLRNAVQPLGLHLVMTTMAVEIRR